MSSAKVNAKSKTGKARALSSLFCPKVVPKPTKRSWIKFIETQESLEYPEDAECEHKNSVYHSKHKRSADEIECVEIKCMDCGMITIK